MATHVVSAHKFLSRGEIYFPAANRQYFGIKSKFVSGASRSLARTPYITQDWLVVKPRKSAAAGTVDYVVEHPEPKSFPFLLKSPQKSAKYKPREPPSSYFPTPVTPQTLEYGKARKLYGSIPKERESNDRDLPRIGTTTTLAHVTQRWEHGDSAYKEWRNRRKTFCFTEATEQNAISEERILTSKTPSVTTANECRPKETTPESLLQSLRVDTPDQPKVNKVLDSAGRFHDESASSSADSGNSAEVIKDRLKNGRFPQNFGSPLQHHQRKFRRLRRATRNLISWIESLRPQKKLNFHYVTLNDGTNTNATMKPYVPYPEEQQPLPVIKEEEVVEMVKNAYGARPSLALRIAVHDMENLPDELEKFDNYYYLRDRMFAKLKEHHKERKETSKVPKKLTPKVGNRYSFGFAPLQTRKTGGGIYDARVGKRCRYGAWYLRHSLWKKMGLKEAIRTPGVKQSDEAFERVTGQRRLDVEGGLHTSDPVHQTDLCDLYTSKEFYKRLKDRDIPVPTWLQGCEKAIARDEHERKLSRTGPHGSEVWRRRRTSKAHSVLHFRLHNPPHRPTPFLRNAKRWKSTGRALSRLPGTRNDVHETVISSHSSAIEPWCYDLLRDLELKNAAIL